MWGKLTSYYDPADGWFYAVFDVNKKGSQAIQGKKSHVSCTYKGNWGIGTTINGITYDQVLINGQYQELALVLNPRYEKASIQENSNKTKGETMAKADDILNKVLSFIQKNDGKKDKDTEKKEEKPDKNNPVDKDNKKQENDAEDEATFFYTENGQGIVTPDGNSISIQKLAEAVKKMDKDNVQENDKKPVNMDDKIPNTDVTFKEAMNLLSQKKDKPPQEKTQKNSLDHVKGEQSQDFIHMQKTMQTNDNGITNYLSQTAVIAIFNLFQQVSNCTAKPNRLLISNKERRELNRLMITNPGAGSLTRLKYLEDAGLAEDEDFKIKTLPFLDASYNSEYGINKNRYMLYRYKEKNEVNIFQPIPKKATMTAVVPDGAFGQRVGFYGSLGGVIMKRPQEVIYFDYN